MEINKKIAAKIKETRMQKGFSADYVASKLKISRTAYSQLENGRVEIPFNRAEAIASIFEVPFTVFIPKAGSSVVINHDQSTGFIGNQINHYTDENIVKLLQEAVSVLQRLIDKLH